MLEASEILFLGRGTTAQTWYRIALPGIYLNADWSGVYGEPPGLVMATGIIKGETSLPKYEDYRVVVIEQPSGTKWLNLIRRLRGQGVKVLYEVDDYLHGVAKQKSHDFAKHYSKQRLVEHEICMRACDGIIASTPYIARRYAKFNRNIYICRNGLDVGRFNLTRPERPTVNIGWAGATGHLNALLPWLMEIGELMARHEDTCFVSIGDVRPAHMLGSRFGPARCTGIPFTALENYPAAMTMIDIALAPSSDSSWYRGKDLDLETPVLTTEGWSTQGVLEVGDRVFGSRGEPTRVTGVSRIFRRQRCYELTFTDGARITAGAGHLWPVYDTSRRRERLVETSEIAKTYKYERSDRPHVHWRYRLQASAAVASEPQDLPIDPYILGYWLGDGCSRAAKITTSRKDTPHLAEAVENAGYCVVSVRSSNAVNELRFNTPRGGKGVRDGIQRTMRALGLLTGAKHIPEIYLEGSIEQRRSLLAGLLDSDGTIAATGGRITYSVVNERLARDVLGLVRSLGIRTTGLRTRAAKLNGRVVGTAYVLTWHDAVNPFRLARKADRWRPLSNPRHGRISIVGVREVASRPTRCIQVEADDGVYLAGALFTPTHNSDLRWLEAGALGIPLIADRRVYPDIEPDVTGCWADTAAEMGEAAEMLYQDPELRRHIGNEAREHVREERSMTEMAPQWFEVACAVAGEYESVHQL